MSPELQHWWDCFEQVAFAVSESAAELETTCTASPHGAPDCEALKRELRAVSNTMAEMLDEMHERAAEKKEGV